MVALLPILERIQTISSEMRKAGSGVVWFRGHRKSEWELTSTLHRYINRHMAALARPFTADEKRQLMLEEMKSLYRRFQAEAWPLLAATERSEWGVLFTMQHYRLPTRLLDWTESLACALFFTQEHRLPVDPAAIWIFDPERLNEITLGQRALVGLSENVEVGVLDLRKRHPKWAPEADDPLTIAVTPVFTNPRMTAQRSVFTLAGDSFVPLEEQFDGRLVKDGILVKVELAPDTFEDVRDYLRINGLTAFTYYPDLDGLGRAHEARVQDTLLDIHRWLPNVLKKDDA